MWYYVLLSTSCEISLMISVPSLGIHYPTHRQTKNNLAEPASQHPEPGDICVLMLDSLIDTESVLTSEEVALTENIDKHIAVLKSGACVWTNVLTEFQVATSENFDKLNIFFNFTFFSLIYLPNFSEQYFWSHMNFQNFATLPSKGEV